MIKLILPITTISLNELLRMHFQARKRLKQSYGWEILAELNKQGLNHSDYEAKNKRQVHIYSFRKSLLDHDNFIGGLKCLIDSLVEMDLLVNDNGDYLELIAEQSLRPKKPATEIIIKELT